MSDRRKTDSLETKSWFRSDRMIQEAEHWFYQTREGSMEGPFESQLEANLHLHDYVKLVTSGLLKGSAGLALEPLSPRVATY